MISARLLDGFLAWARRRCERMGGARQVVTFDDQPLFLRYEFLRIDETDDHTWDGMRPRPDRRPRQLPWWTPCNVFLHVWDLAGGVAEQFHDHPRRSVTICLRGRIVEMTPWGERLLKPGAVVIRSRKAIHAFRAADGFAGECWTLFICGRRRWRQNTYEVCAR